jgi:polysaccharide pyruvyl transferase WcaK-like protein/SAM-dependent methyltransferase
VSTRQPPARAPRQPRPLRVGLFGRLASGNIGNDASMEAILGYLRSRHPEVRVDAMCNGPERMRRHYGIEATQIFHEHAFARRPSRPVRAAWLAWEKCADAVSIAAWVRGHDVVIIPGMGVLEATLPIAPWGMPYSMCLLGLYGRLMGAKVALISVGASQIRQPVVRWLLTRSARLARYRSFRDVQSRDDMARQGVDTSRDPVYPDLAFALPVPPYDPGEQASVGIGVMRYSGGNDDRARAAEIHDSYVHGVKAFARWLLDNGYRIRLFFGDDDDEVVARDVLADLTAHCPQLTPETASLEPVATFDDVTRVVQSVSIVVATRFHNIICSVRLAKPTLSLGYARKSTVIMTDAGLADFCLAAGSLDPDQIIERFTELERRAPDLRKQMQEATAEKARLLDEQFALLSGTLLQPGSPPPNPAAVTATETGTGQGAGEPGAQGPQPGAPDALYKKDFWRTENLRYSGAHLRMVKVARTANAVAQGRPAALLDVGCGPATLESLLAPNISYYGIDIAIKAPAPHLLEADLLTGPIRFGDRRFDIIVAQGFFEYVGKFQSRKLAEIAAILGDNGTFITSYVNFGHRRRHVYQPYSNVQPFARFRASVAEHFTVREVFPTSYNWPHRDSGRPLLRAMGLQTDRNVPLLGRAFAVQYVLVCTAR